jgi:hypothetical protein
MASNHVCAPICGIYRPRRGLTDNSFFDKLFRHSHNAPKFNNNNNEDSTDMLKEISGPTSFIEIIKCNSKNGDNTALLKKRKHEDTKDSKEINKGSLKKKTPISFKI